MYKLKKSLGQNFLKSAIALKKIVEAGEISLEDIILEIGPGKGILTEKLLDKSNHIIAIEKDRELFEFLKEKFKKEILENKLILIKEDILKFNIFDIVSNFCSGPRFSGSLPQPDHSQKLKLHQKLKYKIIANIPYNITGAILKKFLTEKNQPELMVLMVQNEVAKRIIAHDGKESILSISVKAYGEPKMVMKVPARYFSPAPKVDSAVISIKNISRKNFTSPQPSPTPPALPLSGETNCFPLISGSKGVQVEGETIDENKFWEILHAGFAHKRKKLSSNLKKYNPLLISPFTGGEKGEGIASALNLGNKRAEELTLTDWINLVKSIDINKKE
ncbi:MAG: 16S rRNA (adenine(1518)-N(6)/adenine(1519)-N(6))-dimethyltransferase RsmA [Candidatus Paceibacterota bacterium]|jgi:16S rRNA (adenine1518-N6/adenine1519-N6)-dimethyltransferase